MSIPYDDIPITEWVEQLRDLSKQDMTTARRQALLRLLWEESYFSRQGLTSRVEFILGRGCFGPSPISTFRGDISSVRRTLEKAGHRLYYSRKKPHRGYHIEGRPLLDERIQRIIAGSVAEVDAEQIAVSRKLTAAQQFRQGCSMVELAEKVATYRLRKRQPKLSEAKARYLIHTGEVRQ